MEEKKLTLKLTEKQLRIIYKILSAANVMYTVMEAEYTPNLLDPVITEVKAVLDEPLKD